VGSRQSVPDERERFTGLAAAGDRRATPLAVRGGRAGALLAARSPDKRDE
jgi:hypothetical protein